MANYTKRTYITILRNTCSSVDARRCKSARGSLNSHSCCTQKNKVYSYMIAVHVDIVVHQKKTKCLSIFGIYFIHNHYSYIFGYLFYWVVEALEQSCRQPPSLPSNYSTVRNNRKRHKNW